MDAWHGLTHDPNDFNKWEWPQDPTDYRHERATEVEAWPHVMMRSGVFAKERDDYREIMECAAHYLGAQVRMISVFNMLHNIFIIIIHPAISSHYYFLY